MTDTEYMQQAKSRLEQFRDEQKRVEEKLAGDMSRLYGLRLRLPLALGALALGLGLSVGYQIGQR